MKKSYNERKILLKLFIYFALMTATLELTWTKPEIHVLHHKMIEGASWASVKAKVCSESQMISVRKQSIYFLISEEERVSSSVCNNCFLFIFNFLLIDWLFCLFPGLLDPTVHLKTCATLYTKYFKYLHLCIWLMLVFRAGLLYSTN